MEPAPGKPKPWQFSLRGLLGVTTAAAVAAAIAAAWGAGTLVPFVGLAVCYLNFRGALVRWQAARGWRGPLLLAWSLFSLSLLLPAVNVLGPQPGWQAAWSAVLMQADAMRWRDWDGWNGYLMVTLANLANLAMLVSPFFARRPASRLTAWYVGLSGVAAAAVWCFALDGGSQWLVGYYVWSAAFAALLSCVRISGRILLVIVATPPVLLLSGAIQ